MTTPTGITVGYAHDSDGRVTAVTSNLDAPWSTLANNLLYQPANERLYAWRFGSNVARLKALDADGRLTRGWSPAVHDVSLGLWNCADWRGCWGFGGFVAAAPSLITARSMVARLTLPDSTLPGAGRRLLAGRAEGQAQARRQDVEVPVQRPEQGVRGEQNGSEQRQIDGTAARIMEFLPVDQGEYFVGRRADGLLQFHEVAERALARRRWRSASEFEHDERMTQDLIHLEQCPEH
jgi:hypothetical protein